MHPELQEYPVIVREYRIEACPRHCFPRLQKAVNQVAVVVFMRYPSRYRHASLQIIGSRSVCMVEILEQHDPPPAASYGGIVQISIPLIWYCEKPS
jgi:hypothetical protein